MNTKNNTEVRQSIKGIVEYIEDALKLTVDRILEIKEGPRIREAYEVLDDWYRERHIKRIQKEGIGRVETKARIHMMKARPTENQEEEETFDEIVYLIESKGDLQYEKNQQEIQEIHEKQEKAVEDSLGTQHQVPRSNHRRKDRSP